MTMKGRDADALAAELEAHPDYRVLRRLDVAREWPALKGRDVAQAVVLDTETTGLDPATDRVIELALVKFEYSRTTGEVGRVLAVYDGLEDPGVPIPPESTALHGITDEMVRGQRLDESAIERLLDGVGLVIAHNAAFDRPFTERRLPGLASLAWGCSVHDVRWKEHGFASSALEFLAYRLGFFFDAHRAEIDCRATLEILRSPLADTGGTVLKTLLEAAREPSLRVWALGSPFETKDLLKARGYRWESEKRVWYRDLGEEEREAECAWLKETVYGGKSVTVEVETFDARVRYSGREGKRERLRL
jgi:DNA polymerase III subunit epsilon